MAGTILKFKIVRKYCTFYAAECNITLAAGMVTEMYR